MHRSIHIATDTTSPLWDIYLISLLAWHWNQAGDRITSGPVKHIDPALDLAILHMDRTKIEPELVPANPSGRRFLNGGILDISKKRFSTMMVAPGDSWEGAVIVKSNLNCYGDPEWNGGSHGWFARKRREWAKRSWRMARMLPEGTYPVLPRLSEVPDWVWADPSLIVERFVPEMDQGRYCLRGWVFFGKRGYTYRLFSDRPVVKARAILGHEFLEDPPSELVAFRDANGWDFGKFDYVMVDGKPILLDINKTPTITTGPDTPRLRHLAGGLDEMLPEGE
jgi:hypothetical protein